MCAGTQQGSNPARPQGTFQSCFPNVKPTLPIDLHICDASVSLKHLPELGIADIQCHIAHIHIAVLGVGSVNGGWVQGLACLLVLCWPASGAPAVDECIATSITNPSEQGFGWLPECVSEQGFGWLPECVSEQVSD